MAARERAEESQEATHGAPLTEEEQALKYEQDLWEKAHTGLTELRTVLEEIAQLEQERRGQSVRSTPMEPHKRTHLVNELMQEATLMRTVLAKAIEATQTEAQQRQESPHITDDELTSPPAHTLQDESTSWGEGLSGTDWYSNQTGSDRACGTGKNRADNADA